MTLHVFNPEHDLALASGLSNFTAPHAGRRLRADLGYLPALWAGEGDCVLVEHVEQARRAYGRLRARVGGSPCRFVDKSQLSRLAIDRVSPWGWDLALRAALIRYGVPAEACPSESEIAAVRDLSHRRHAAEVLSLLTPHSTLLTPRNPRRSHLRRNRRSMPSQASASGGQGSLEQQRQGCPFHRRRALRLPPWLASEHHRPTGVCDGRANVSESQGFWHGVRGTSRRHYPLHRPLPL